MYCAALLGPQNEIVMDLLFKLFGGHTFTKSKDSYFLIRQCNWSMRIYVRMVVAIQNQIASVFLRPCDESEFASGKTMGKKTMDPSEVYWESGSSPYL